MFDFIISIFGIVIAHRILYLLEKFEEFFSVKHKFFAYFLQIPFVLSLFFKDLTAFVIIYIGIISIILILLDKIIRFFLQNSFEKLHLSIIQRLLLSINSGQSVKSAVKILWNEMSSNEKTIFSDLPILFDQKQPNQKLLGKFQTPLSEFFYRELQEIIEMQSDAREQLCVLRNYLCLLRNLRHKSRKSVALARAQACICVLIYLVFVLISVKFLQFQIISWPMLFSITLLMAGAGFILKLERSFSWKT